MGGTSSSQQQSQTISQPWAPAQPGLNNIIGQIGGQLGNTGVNATEQNAFNQLQTAANQGNPFAAPITSYASNLLSGGGANNQAGNLQSAYDAYKTALGPWASGAMADPSQNPALAAALQTINADTTNSINQQFAGAGRDLSGLNQQAIARGLAQGEAPLLLNAQQQGLTAAGNLYNAGNTTSGLLSGLNQQALANQGVGVPAAEQALEAQQYGPTQTLGIQSMLRNLPVSSIGQLAQLLVPIAGLGGQTNSTSSGTQTMSGAQQFGLIAGGLGSLFKSSRALKENIVRVGRLRNGLNLYRFSYKGERGSHIGVMADEVAFVRPRAVRPGVLFSMVDYAEAVR